ncbi:MAG TPA: hypothetical protein VN675_15375 [Burkholderiales bacterium]|nr:hypothetical protein [Burkholderiales bacterium]
MSPPHKRIALGTLCLAYVPFLGWISLVTTPAYVWWPMFSAFVPPVVFASLALGLIVSERAARVTALFAACVLAVWLLENVGSVYWRIVDWERWQGAALGDALVGALEQSVPRAPYWLAVLLPLCVAGGYLYVSRRK